MFEDSTTQCLLVAGIFRKPVVAQFDQREGSSDGGALLLKAANQHYRLVEELTTCLRDERQEGRPPSSIGRTPIRMRLRVVVGPPFPMISTGPMKR
jgi:hypothetical protein